VKLNRTFSCRDARAVSAPEPNRTGYLSSPKHISKVATSQTKGDASIRNLPSCFILGNEATASNSKTDSTSTDVGNDIDEEGHDRSGIPSVRTTVCSPLVRARVAAS